jgi:hypothetical protein
LDPSVEVAKIGQFMTRQAKGRPYGNHSKRKRDAGKQAIDSEEDEHRTLMNLMNDRADREFNPTHGPLPHLTEIDSRGCCSSRAGETSASRWTNKPCRRWTCGATRAHLPLCVDQM